MAKGGTPVDWFWEKVDKTVGGCWNWTGSKTDHGYGYFRYDGKTRRAHRVSYELATGRRPASGLQVCHHCDNPGCVNPAHLFLGTARDNILDCISKDRKKPLAILRGDDNPRSKLTTADIRFIKSLPTWNAVISRKCRARFGISSKYLSNIRTGRRWAHVTPFDFPTAFLPEIPKQTSTTR